MNKRQKEILLSLLANNFELNKLHKEHKALEDRLSRYQARNFLTPQEELEVKQLKTKKLKGVDRIMSIIEASDQASATIQ